MTAYDRCAPLFARDNQTMLEERLSADALRWLTCWFWSDEGGARGAALLYAAPAMDTWLGRLAPPCEDEPQASALAMFGAGAAAGVAVRDRVRAGFDDHNLDCPYLQSLDLELALEQLGDVAHPAAFLPYDLADCHRVGRALVQVSRALDLSVEACFRVATARARFDEGDAPRRLLFWAGVMVAGFAAPLVYPLAPRGEGEGGAAADGDA